jgi:hypothetical protein
MPVGPHERVRAEHRSRGADLYPPPLEIVGVGVGGVGVLVGVGGVVGSGVAVGVAVGLPLPPPPPLLDVAVAAGEGVCGATVNSAVAEGNSGARVGGASAEAPGFPKASPTTKSVRKIISSAPAIASSAIRPAVCGVSLAGGGPEFAMVSCNCAPQEGQNAPAGTPRQPQVAQDDGVIFMSQPSPITALRLRENTRK